MDADWIPPNAVLTPNRKELEILFNIKDINLSLIKKKAKKHHCVIVVKGPETVVVSEEKEVLIKGGNPGLTKGGSGDVLAGLMVALLAKNNSFLSAAAASYIEKFAADRLYEKVGTIYNMDDLSDLIPHVFRTLLRQERRSNGKDKL